MGKIIPAICVISSVLGLVALGYYSYPRHRIPAINIESPAVTPDAVKKSSDAVRFRIGKYAEIDAYRADLAKLYSNQ